MRSPDRRLSVLEGAIRLIIVSVLMTILWPAIAPASENDARFELCIRELNTLIARHGNLWKRLEANGVRVEGTMYGVYGVYRPKNMQDCERTIADVQLQLARMEGQQHALGDYMAGPYHQCSSEARAKQSKLMSLINQNKTAVFMRLGQHTGNYLIRVASPPIRPGECPEALQVISGGLVEVETLINRLSAAQNHWEGDCLAINGDEVFLNMAPGVYRNGKLKIRLDGTRSRGSKLGASWKLKSNAVGFDRLIESKQARMQDTSLCPGVELTAECEVSDDHQWGDLNVHCSFSEF